jgi:hypothetical protein
VQDEQRLIDQSLHLTARKTADGKSQYIRVSGLLFQKKCQELLSRQFVTLPQSSHCFSR